MHIYVRLALFNSVGWDRFLRQQLAEPRRPVGLDQSAFSPIQHNQRTGTGNGVTMRDRVISVINLILPLQFLITKHMRKVEPFSISKFLWLHP